MIEAIFFDIDGTLASFKTHTVPEHTKTVLKSLRDKGIKIFVATGRGTHELDVIKDIEFDGYVTLNGQCCYANDNTLIYTNEIDKNDLSTLITYCNKNQIACSFTDGKEAYYNLINEQVEKIHQIIHTPIGPIKDSSYPLEHTVYQSSIFLNKEQEIQLLKQLPNCLSSRWFDTFCDISPKNGTKLNGIKELCKYYSIDPNNYMAFGDGGNDIAMLKGAKISVAMANGNVEVKEIANYITEDVDHDGIYNALKHFKIL